MLLNIFLLFFLFCLFFYLTFIFCAYSRFWIEFEIMQSSVSYTRIAIYMKWRCSSCEFLLAILNLVCLFLWVNYLYVFRIDLQIVLKVRMNGIKYFVWNIFLKVKFLCRKSLLLIIVWNCSKILELPLMKPFDVPKNPAIFLIHLMPQIPKPYFTRHSIDPRKTHFILITTFH